MYADGWSLNTLTSAKPLPVRAFTSSLCFLARISPGEPSLMPTTFLARSSSFVIDEASPARTRSEEHTSELQSHSDLVCRLLLEKKKKKQNNRTLSERKPQ